MKENERYIVMDRCMFLNKCSTKMCLAKERERDFDTLTVYKLLQTIVHNNGVEPIVS